METETFTAIAIRNDPLNPANAGWHLRVFDSTGDLVGDRLAPDTQFFEGSVEEKLIAWLPSGFTAEPNDVSFDGTSYRFSAVRRRG